MISDEIKQILENKNSDEKVRFLINYSNEQDVVWRELKSNNDKIQLKVATSFSGIGAPEHALSRLGIKNDILFAGDIDEYCRQTYFANNNIQEKQWHTDVRQFDATPYASKIDLYIGGSPCQSFSIGGKRKGFEESRGTLFYEYARIVKESKPKVFVFENVTGLLNHDGGRTWDVVSETFNELGYYWKCWTLNSKNYGIPQNRLRIFVIGFRCDLQDYFQRLNTPHDNPLVYDMGDLLEPIVQNKYYLPRKGFERVVDPKHNRHVAVNGRIARTQIANQQYNWYGDMRFESTISSQIMEDERIWKGFYKGSFGVARCLTPRECLRLMGFDDTFKIVVNDQQMWKQCGNSIVVNVLMEVIKSIIKTGVFYVE